jgi:hypothetical protein
VRKKLHVFGHVHCRHAFAWPQRCVRVCVLEFRECACVDLRTMCIENSSHSAPASPLRVVSIVYTMCSSQTLMPSCWNTKVSIGNRPSYRIHRVRFVYLFAMNTCSTIASIMSIF